MPLVAPLRPLLNFTDGRVLTPVYQLLGGAPKPLVKWAFQLSSFQKLITKPLAVATQLDDADFLAQIEAVDRFTANMIAYPGRSFGQLYHRFVRSNVLSTGRFELDDRTIDLSAITVPVLVFAGATDGIAPVNAVKAVVPLLSGAAEVRFEIVPGGHLGMLTGRAARGSTWRVLDEWVGRVVDPREADANGGQEDGAQEDRRQEDRTRSPPARKSPAKKPAAKKTASKKAPAKKPSPDPDAIGVNPTRRYGSAGSRSLAR